MESVRTCIVCRQKGNKDNFIKFVYNKNNEIFIVYDTRLDGRGAYICKNTECIKKCIKSKSLNRAFKHNIPQKFYEELEEKFGIK